MSHRGVLLAKVRNYGAPTSVFNDGQAASQGQSFTHGSRIYGSRMVLSSREYRLLRTQSSTSSLSEINAVLKSLRNLAEKLSVELPRGRAAWRGTALVKAARLLIQTGGIDLAASLAYFTILSLLPLVALVIMVATVFVDPEGVGDQLAEVLVYYFPSSRDLIREAVDNLLSGSLAIGVVASVSIVVGANGLFMAANRAVNRLFGIEAMKVVQITIAEVSIATLVVILFMLSIGVTAFLQVVVSFGEGIVQSTGGVSMAAVLVLGAVSTILPAVLTMVVFAFVYRRLPTVHVEWKNAAFGAMVSVAMFEIAKHLFFWFSNLATQRSAVYGPIASIVVLMMWGYIAGLIFLYGAALAKCAEELRPTASGQSDG